MHAAANHRPQAEFGRGTAWEPHATSLRMGRLGYLSEAQDSLAVSYNSLESYAGSLQDALTRPYLPYEAIGVLNGNDYLQLSTTLLQIENEFYGKIRPKRTIRQGERPLHALRERGVEYVEVRLMDLDPYSLVGINASTMRMLDIFLLHCLLTDSPNDTPGELAAISRRPVVITTRGPPQSPSGSAPRSPSPPAISPKSSDPPSRSNCSSASPSPGVS